MVHLLALQKAGRSLGLHFQHVFLNVVHERRVSIDDEVEHRVQQVIRALHEQLRRFLELLAQGRVGPLRPMPDRNDMTMADEDFGFTIFDDFAVQARRPRDDEELVAIDLDLGQLVRLDRVLDGERVQVVA